MEGRRIVSAGIAGLLFGAGLAVSGMINPARIIGFLDIAALFGPGIWDPTLAFVMAAALAVALPGFALLQRRGAPLFAARFDWPTRRAVDARLVAGSALFGVGWGLVGFCPGPAIAALASGLAPVVIFASAMVGGMAVYRIWAHR